MKSKKSQVWGLDLVIALTIFLVGIVIFFIYALNFTNEAEENLDALFNDGNIIANILLSEGVPADWNSGNVVAPGLLYNNQVNETKLERFYNLVNSDYAETRKILNTKFDFYFYFTEKIDINGNEVDGIGKLGVNRDNLIEIEQPNNIVKITRITLYKNKPTQLNLYMWD